MDRRQALQLLMGGAALQLVSHDLFAALRTARRLLAAETSPRTLDPHQNATVAALAEMIIPKTETPGAADAGVGQFIDLILTEWYNDEERSRFLHGLADVDARTQTLFGKQFVDCSQDQRAQILMALGEQMMEEAYAVRDSVRRYRGALPRPDKNFYYMLRHLTLTAYYTSEEAASNDQAFKVIPNRYERWASVPNGEDLNASEG
jgi:hypothetical protein